jgi:hypothetical protein
MPDRVELLNLLEQRVAELVELTASLPDTLVEIYDGWSARDVLGHLTFWHESFARNTRDLSLGLKPKPLKGRLMDLNQQGVEEMRAYSLDEVTRRLRAAQRLISEHILNPLVVMIPYRRGSRDYSAEEHLQVVSEHIGWHIRDLRKRAFP